MRVEKGELEGEGAWRETDIRAIEKFWRILAVSSAGSSLFNLGEKDLGCAGARLKLVLYRLSKIQGPKDSVLIY